MPHILLIDDDPSVRSGMARFLRMLSYQVTEASNGAEALRMAEHLELDLVVTDINMPEVDGIEVILSLGEKRPGLPVIAVSGGGRLPKELLLVSAEVLGAVTTLRKPFELGELQFAVSSVLAG